jgi:hypothetical protein
MRYRIYELGSCGEIVSGADLSALHDEQSIAEAADHINRYGLEIWQGNRKVIVISPPISCFRRPQAASAPQRAVLSPMSRGFA